MKKRVIAGPYRTAQRYARSQGWDRDNVVIITRAHQLARLDPVLIAEVLFIRTYNLGERIYAEIWSEFEKIRTLWPVPLAVA